MTDDQFIERIEAAPLRDGEYIGRGEVGVVAGSNEQHGIERLQERVNALLDRIADLERQVADAQASS
jgi:hypothetical protein